MKKRLIALLLVFAMIAPFVYPTARVQAAVTNRVGDFYYASERYITKDHPATFYYSDSYFAQSAYNYQDSLATMSMCLALSSFRSNRTDDYTKKTQNLSSLLSQCGFGAFAANNDYRKCPTKDTTGVACAYKTINVNEESYKLITLAVCGGRYGDEWGGGFEVGKSGAHASCQRGADEAYAFLKKYIADHNITGNIKLWVASYGIGAGKANLLAGKLDDGAFIGNNVRLQRENMYAFCFESPRVALTEYGLNDGQYKNIYCINNPCDIIANLPSPKYGFGVFGVQKEYPTRTTDSRYSTKRNEMLKKLRNLSGSDEYLIDNFQMQKINVVNAILGTGAVEPDYQNNLDQGQFIDLFVDDITNSCAPNRSEFVNVFQSDLCELFRIVFSNSDEHWMDYLYIFVDNIMEDILNIGVNIVLGNESALTDIFKDHMYDALRKSGVVAYTSAEVDKFSKLLAKTAVTFGREHPNETVTVFDNIPQLFQAYYPPVNLAWLQSVDPNYAGTGRSMNSCAVTLSQNSYTYDGTAKMPAVKVTNGSVILTRDTDYVVVYDNNINAGTATVRIKGIGLYAGTITKSFTINKTLNAVAASNYTKRYSTKTQKFSLVAKTKGNARLRYQSNNSSIKIDSKGKVAIKPKYIGKATITIVADATQNYNRTTKKVTVTCTPTKMALSSVKSSKAKALTIKWKKNTSAGGYQIYLSTRKKFDSNTKAFTINKQKTVSRTITGLGRKKVYYVKVRAYKIVKGKAYYGPWSSVKSNKTK